MTDRDDVKVFDLKTEEWRTWEQVSRAVSARLPEEAVDEVREAQTPTPDQEIPVFDLAAEEEVSWQEMERRVTARFEAAGIKHGAADFRDDEGSDTEEDVSESGRLELTEQDEGKQVLDPDGEDVGIITRVDAGGAAYVDPNPGVAVTIAAKLGWGDKDEDGYALPPESIGEITEEYVKMK